MEWMISEPYLDYAATTPLDPRVQAVMSECALSLQGTANPSSTHALGAAAAEQVADSAESIGRLLNADPAGLIWTSGATEANNLAILGTALALLSREPERRRILVLATDHSAAIEPARAAEKWGFSAVTLPVEPSGALLPEVLSKALDTDVALVSLASVNNETGVMQDIKTLAPMIRAVGARLHVDATQAVGRMPVDVDADQIDLLSFSSHKFYGPKGIGGLYCRPGLALEPLLYGGGQQAGRRPGTLPLPLIKGMAAAFSFADGEVERDRQQALRFRL
ncbi:MAG: aminotransferase class V-fold PLP-dependent enzyme, partial [Gammaproteobacteria bacterium]|nr:aminotransferase class V-fold PLP-dependent enzyme [Gammaproteobacteria bacterium]